MMACATPPATRMARAIVANTSTTRRMASPLIPLHALHRRVCTQGNRAMRLGLLLRRTPTGGVQHSLGPDRPGPPPEASEKPGCSGRGEASEGTRLDD